MTRLTDALHAPASTFVSVVPACGCARGPTEIAQFSLRTGRRLRTLARIRTSGALSAARSDRNGDLWMTFAAGPRLRAGTAGGDPQPDSCASALVRYDPSDGVARIVRRFPSSVTVGDAVPSPDGQRVAVLEGGCATSFFNEHIMVLGVHGGPAVSVGARATACHSLPDVAWNPAGTELVFPFGPSSLPPSTHFTPRGTCAASHFNRVAVVSALHPSEPGRWTLWRAQPHCSYQAAAFAGSGESGPGDVVADPSTGQMLVSEDEAANSGVRAYDWVWALHGSRLRVLDRVHFPGADYLDAQPY